jgi:Tfp pilus assembly protein PilV
VEVLVSTAVASVALAGAAGLLASSARAVAEGELETTAIWVASRAIEEWRASTDAPLEGHHRADRSGDRVPGAGLFDVAWTVRPEPGSAQLWRVTATVTSARLLQNVTAEAVVSRAAPW